MGPKNESAEQPSGCKQFRHFIYIYTYVRVFILYSNRNKQPTLSKTPFQQAEVAELRAERSRASLNITGTSPSTSSSNFCFYPRHNTFDKNLVGRETIVITFRLEVRIAKGSARLSFFDVLDLTDLTAQPLGGSSSEILLTCYPHYMTSY